MKVLAAIPARYGSRRFPGKALYPVGGRPLVARVAAAVVGSRVADRVLVATDDRRIADAVASVDVEVVLSDEAFRSGSDRVAAAVAGRGLDPAGDVVLDVQGDEALVSGDLLRAALEALGSEMDLGTVAIPLGAHQLGDPDVVKVAFDPHDGRALAFGRGSLAAAAAEGEQWAHVGIYAYRPGALSRFAALPTSLAEARERLEQLRAMEAGMRVGVAARRVDCHAINRIEDVALVEARLARAELDLSREARKEQL